MIDRRPTSLRPSLSFAAAPSADGSASSSCSAAPTLGPSTLSHAYGFRALALAPSLGLAASLGCARPLRAAGVRGGAYRAGACRASPRRRRDRSFHASPRTPSDSGDSRGGAAAVGSDDSVLQVCACECVVCVI